MKRLGFLVGLSVGVIVGVATSRVRAEDVAKDIGDATRGFARRVTTSAEDLRRRSDEQIEDILQRVDDQFDEMRRRVDEQFEDVKRRVEEEVEKNIDTQVQTLVRAGQAREQALETFEDDEDDADAMFSPEKSTEAKDSKPTGAEGPGRPAI